MNVASLTLTVRTSQLLSCAVSLGIQTSQGSVLGVTSATSYGAAKSSGSSSNNNAGIIAGVICGVAALIAVVGIAYVIHRRRYRVPMKPLFEMEDHSRFMPGTIQGDFPEDSSTA
jgi:hypothetical protein